MLPIRLIYFSFKQICWLTWLQDVLYIEFVPKHDACPNQLSVPFQASNTCYIYIKSNPRAFQSSQRNIGWWRWDEWGKGGVRGLRSLNSRKICVKGWGGNQGHRPLAWRWEYSEISLLSEQITGQDRQRKRKANFRELDSSSCRRRSTMLTSSGWFYSWVSAGSITSFLFVCVKQG